MRYLILLFVILSCSKEAKKQTQVNTCIQKDLTYSVHYENYEYKQYSIGKNISIKDSVLKIWDSKKRKTPKALMIAKGTLESSFRSNIYLQEKKYIIDKKDSLKYTDMGLFQVMGFNIPNINITISR